MSKLAAAIRFCGLFEAELLVDLMLRYWGHPSTNDKELVNLIFERRPSMPGPSASIQAALTLSTSMLG